MDRRGGVRPAEGVGMKREREGLGEGGGRGGGAKGSTEEDELRSRLLASGKFVKRS